MANWTEAICCLFACVLVASKGYLVLRPPTSSVEGFNLDVNDGEVAGQTVFHCHIHLIPRRRGDVGDPMGGLRNTIPGKGVYG